MDSRSDVVNLVVDNPKLTNTVRTNSGEDVTVVVTERIQRSTKSSVKDVLRRIAVVVVIEHRDTYERTMREKPADRRAKHRN